MYLPRVAGVQWLGTRIDAQHRRLAEGTNAHAGGRRNGNVVGDARCEVCQQQRRRRRINGHIFEYTRRIVHIQALDEHIVAGEDACRDGTRSVRMVVREEKMKWN